MNGAHRPSVLVLSRNYPSAAFPMLGVWVQRMVDAAAPMADLRVIAPVPYAPPFLPTRLFRRYRAIPTTEGGGDRPVIHHPRIPVGPGYLMHSYEARIAYPWIRSAVHTMCARREIDLLHAHFIYPDGVIAARLGRRYDIPVMVSEHNVWLPWLTRFPRVRGQVLAALPHVRLLAPVSRAVQTTVEMVAPHHVRTELLPNVLDAATFRERDAHEPWDPHRLLFVGAVRFVKGLDILVRALALLHRTRPQVRLSVVGEPFHRAYRRHERAVRQLVHELKLVRHVTFEGYAEPTEVARAMRTSAVVVVPSRRESFSIVTAEALASGTPVVATRCGGPEEIITPETGRLVPVDDVQALAAALDDVLGCREMFSVPALRAAVVPRFAQATVGRRLMELYHTVLA